jgi:single-strand DNA-binding protein
MYQQITLIGNLGGDPEMRYTPSGVPVTSFSMAVTRNWTGQDGQRQEKTIWFRITAWRKLAETASQYLTKGSKVLVVGTLEEPRAYTDRDGNLRAALEVTADTIRFLSTRGETGAAVPAAAAMAAGAGADAPAMSDEDIPF